MAVKDTQPAASALPNLERGRLPLSLYLAGTVVVMNVCATVLSLMS